MGERQTPEESARLFLEHTPGSDYNGSQGVINVIMENHEPCPSTVRAGFGGDEDDAMEAFQELLETLVLVAQAEARKADNEHAAKTYSTGFSDGVVSGVAQTRAGRI